MYYEIRQNEETITDSAISAYDATQNAVEYFRNKMYEDGESGEHKVYVDLVITDEKDQEVTTDVVLDICASPSDYSGETDYMQGAI